MFLAKLRKVLLPSRLDSNVVHNHIVKSQRHTGILEFDELGRINIIDMVKNVIMDRDEIFSTILAVVTCWYDQNVSFQIIALSWKISFVIDYINPFSFMIVQNSFLAIRTLDLFPQWINNVMVARMRE